MHWPLATALIVMLSATALCSFAGSQEVEITTEPAHHLVLENEYVRVFQVEVAPHAATLLHRHRHDYVFVLLGATRISNEVEGKAPVEVTLADGETLFTAGGFAHVARNLADTPFRNVTIELLQDKKEQSAISHWPKESGEEAFSGGHRKILFVKDGARVSEIDLDPGATFNDDSDGPKLVVAINRIEFSNGKTHREELAPGGRLWSTHPAFEKKNVGKQPARFVVLEF